MGLIKAPYGFRTKWGYCNAAFVTAGEVVSKVSHQPWEDFIREKILLPLNMKQTLMLSKDLVSVKKCSIVSHPLQRKADQTTLSDDRQSCTGRKHELERKGHEQLA